HGRVTARAADRPADGFGLAYRGTGPIRHGLQLRRGGQAGPCQPGPRLPDSEPRAARARCARTGAVPAAAGARPPAPAAAPRPGDCCRARLGRAAPRLAQTPKGNQGPPMKDVSKAAPWRAGRKLLDCAWNCLEVAAWSR